MHAKMILLIIMLFLLLIILQLRHSLPLSLLPLYIHHPTSHILLYCTWHSPSTFDHVDIHPLLVKFDCCVYHTWHSPSTFNLIDIRPLLFKFDCCVYLTWHSPSTSTSLISIPPLSSLIVVSTLCDIHLPSLLLIFSQSATLLFIIHDLYSSRFE